MVAEPKFPLLRTHYDRDGTHVPELGEYCWQSAPVIVRCAQQVLVVDNTGDEYGSPDADYFCCCPGDCEQDDIFGPAEYGKCHCFSGKVDYTDDECDMQYQISLSGDLIGAECAGPHLMTEDFRLSHCFWDVETGDVTVPGECPEQCAGDDANNIPRPAHKCSVTVEINCDTDPCGQRAYFARVQTTNVKLWQCATLLCGDSQPRDLCNGECFHTYIWIDRDACGCPKPGVYTGYPFSDNEAWCTQVGETHQACDPWGEGPPTTLTLTRVHDNACKPFNCVLPPCDDGDVGEI